MENEKPPSYAQYHSADATVTLIEAEPVQSARLENRENRAPVSSCTRKRIYRFVVPVCLAAIVIALTLFLFLGNKSASNADHNKDSGPSDIAGFRVLKQGENFFTVAWSRPKASFDYYHVVLNNIENASAAEVPVVVGSCANGTILHPDQTEITCDQLQPWNKYAFQSRTHIKGPPARSSASVTRLILTNRKAPPEVTGLYTANQGENFATVAWNRPEASFDFYRVVVFSIYPRRDVTVGSCAKGTILHPDLTEITCSQLEPEKLYTFELQTHVNGPPTQSSGSVSTFILTHKKADSEVSNLKVGNITATSFAVTWERPRDCIEYYTVEVTDHSSGNIGDRHYGVVSCNIDPTINPRQTRVTCTKSDTCTSISVRVKTHTRGPPEHASAGITLENVLIPGTGLPEVTNLKSVAVKNNSFSVTFQTARDCVDRFDYNITDHSNPGRKVNYEKCFEESASKPNNIQIKCTGVEACGKVDFAVAPRKNAPHMHDSPGIALRGIVIRGNCNG